MYNKVDTNLNFVEREKEIEKFWEEHDIFKNKYINMKMQMYSHFMMDHQQQMVNLILDTF